MVIATWISPRTATSTNSARTLPTHNFDNYTLALRKALLFFNAQKCKSLLPYFEGICHSIFY